jgi:hypothetical protein
MLRQGGKRGGTFRKSPGPIDSVRAILLRVATENLIDCLRSAVSSFVRNTREHAVQQLLADRINISKSSPALPVPLDPTAKEKTEGIAPIAIKLGPDLPGGFHMLETKVVKA